jgi:hypothetical protein
MRKNLVEDVLTPIFAAVVKAKFLSQMLFKEKLCCPSVEITLLFLDVEIIFSSCQKGSLILRT